MAKFISVDNLKPNEPVYVRTKADGDINITLYKTNAPAKLLVVPRTRIPIQLTLFASPADIIASDDFRRYVASGILEIVDRETAEKLLDTPDGRKEMERLRKEIFSGIHFANDTTTSNTPSVLEVLSDTTNKVSTRVQDIMVRTDLTDETRLDALKNEVAFIKADDYVFIKSVAAPKSEIAKWADSMLTELEEE